MTITNARYARHYLGRTAATTRCGLQARQLGLANTTTNPELVTCAYCDGSAVVARNVRTAR